MVARRVLAQVHTRSLGAAPRGRCTEVQRLLAHPMERHRCGEGPSNSAAAGPLEPIRWHGVLYWRLAVAGSRALLLQRRIVACRPQLWLAAHWLRQRLVILSPLLAMALMVEQVWTPGRVSRGIRRQGPAGPKRKGQMVPQVRGPEGLPAQEDSGPLELETAGPPPGQGMVRSTGQGAEGQTRQESQGLTG